MSHKRLRMPKEIGLRPSDLRFNISSVLRNHGWGKNKKQEKFDVPTLCGWLGLDPTTTYNRSRVYGVICYWRKHFTPWFKRQLIDGIITGENRFDRWEDGLKSYNNNDAFVFFHVRDGKSIYFIQPSFAEIESMDLKRLNKQMNGIITVLEEMKEFDRHLLPSNRPVGPMLEDGKKFSNLYLKDGPQFKNKRLDYVNSKKGEEDV